MPKKEKNGIPFDWQENLHFRPLKLMKICLELRNHEKFINIK